MNTYRWWVECSRCHKEVIVSGEIEDMRRIHIYGHVCRDCESYLKGDHQ